MPDGRSQGHPERGVNIQVEGPDASSLPVRRLKSGLLRFFLLAALLLLALLFPLACATVIIAPSTPPDPVQVYLIDHGRTSALILPATDGTLVRYVYGDWEWYALGHQSVRQGLRALLWTSPAALGRHRYPGPPDQATVQRTFGTWSQHIYPITVSRHKVERLQTELEATWQQNVATRHVNLDYELEFVQYPTRPYHALHNSNHVTAGWLRELGCRVRGPALYARWKVKSAPPASTL